MVSSQERYFERVLKDAATFFGRWQGASATLWDLSSGHRTLRIVLYRTWGGENLVVSCLDPYVINAPIRWEAAEPIILRGVLPDGGEGFVVSDKNASVEVMCGSVEFRENVRLP